MRWETAGEPQTGTVNDPLLLPMEFSRHPVYRDSFIDNFLVGNVSVYQDFILTATADQIWGREVVPLPIILFRKHYPSYCIPLVALDIVEKAVVEHRTKEQQQTLD